MSYYPARLNRPYDFRVLVEVYIHTHRKNFVHSDFTTYYATLLEALQRLFGIRLSRDCFTINQKVFWMLFQSTVESLLRITGPWDVFQESTLISKKLEESGEPGRLVDRASAVIWEANKASAAAHREILYALFLAMFGECQRIVTSEDLRAIGVDDSKEPDTVNYYDDM